MWDAIKKGLSEEAEHAPTLEWLRHYVESYGQLPDDTLILLHIVMDHLSKDSKYYDKEGGIDLSDRYGV